VLFVLFSQRHSDNSEEEAYIFLFITLILQDITLYTVKEIAHNAAEYDKEE